MPDHTAHAGLFGSYRSDDPPLSNCPPEFIVRAHRMV